MLRGKSNVSIQCRWIAHCPFDLNLPQAPRAQQGWRIDPTSPGSSIILVPEIGVYKLVTGRSARPTQNY
jgi:hypothetical protein